MSTSADIPSLERPEFFDGQRLDAADLASIGTYHRDLRWLHNRTLHDWGIAVGFVVTGKRGDRQVSVTPGYALDCEGHDLVLAQSITLAVPPVAGTVSGAPVTYYLTVSYATDEQLQPSETREGVCSDGGAVRRPETPRLRWQNPTDVSDPASRWRRGRDIVLATIKVQDCELVANVSSAERRQARPSPQPYVMAGQTIAGSTFWQFYPSSTPGSALGVETVVDTSSAGFGMTPVYTAHVAGSRILKAAITGGSGGASSHGQLIDGLATIVDPSPTGFTLRVALPRNLAMSPYVLNPSAAFSATLPETLRATLRWQVMWMGVEGQA